MQHQDVQESASLVLEHPVIGLRYAGSGDDLQRAWRLLTRFQAKRATVFEKVDGRKTKICAVGVSVFVTDAYVRGLKTPPLNWFGPELARRMTAGKSPVLSDREFKEANSFGGLNLLIWEGCHRGEFANDRELNGFIMSTFLDDHRGLQLKELISSQLESVERLRWTLHTGSGLWDAKARLYRNALNKDLAKIISRPHIVGLTREQELERSRTPWTSPSWVGTLFSYEPPRLEFSQGEQRQLLSALSGSTDSKLAGELAVSPNTVRNTWRSIYDRAASHFPELFGDESHPESRSPQRGKEKKRNLLAYLREHPEELRPVSKTAMQRAKASIPSIRQHGVATQHRKT